MNLYTDPIKKRKTKKSTKSKDKKKGFFSVSGFATPTDSGSKISDDYKF